MDESELNAQGLHDDRKREVANLRRLVEEAQQRSATPAPQPPADAAPTHVYLGDGQHGCQRMLGREGEQIQCDQGLYSPWHTRATEPLTKSAAARCGVVYSSAMSLAFAMAAARTHELECKMCLAAAPPVTGDGVETKRTMPWPKPACSVSLPCGGCFTRGICDQLMWESGEAAGLERGRALGAREPAKADAPGGPKCTSCNGCGFVHGEFCVACVGKGWTR